MSVPHRVPHRILHIHAAFTDTPPVRRSVAVINGLGEGFGHAVVSGDNIGGGIDGVDDRIIATRVVGFAKFGGMPTPGKLQRIARDMRGYDLVCTYGGGAINAALAHTLFADLHGLPPLVHHEDSSDFGSRKPSWRSVWLRRIGLGRTAGLVVPSEEMEAVALTAWQQPLGRVKTIPDGIELPPAARRGKPLRQAPLPRLLKRPGELWIGNCSAFLPGERIPMLVSAFAELVDNWHLVLLGDGPDRPLVEAEVDRLGLNHRVHIRPAPDRTDAVAGLFDIYAQAGPFAPDFPPPALSILATGVPLAATGIGSAAQLVSSENAGSVYAEGTREELAQALIDLSFDERQRKAIGAANRQQIAASWSRERMIAAYRRLYTSAIDRGPAAARAAR